MNLNLLVFNVQDMYIFMDKHKDEDINEISAPKWQLLSTSFYPNKDLEKLRHIQALIELKKPDIIMLVEVGGFQSLKNFNKHFLNDDYKVFLEPSNSDRGIDLGYLVKRSLDVEVDFKAYTKNRLKNGRKFARGVFELQIRREEKIAAIFYLTHLKSKLDMKKVDHEGRSQRGAEVTFLKDLYLKKQNKYQDVPILLCGDFNGIIYGDETEQELLPLIQNTGLKDVLDHLEKSSDDRSTYVYFNRHGNRFPMQLDYILINSKFSHMIDTQNTQVLGYGPDFSHIFPSDLTEKRKHPSDHFPLFCKLDLDAQRN